MIQVFTCGLISLILLFCFWCFGMGFCSLFQIRAKSAVEAVVLGVFVYFCVFQCVALPVVFLQQTLRMCTILWVIICCACLIFCILASYKQWLMVLSEHKGAGKLQWFLRVVVMAAVIAMAALTLTESVNSWDSAFYIGQMNEALSTGRFYMYDGRTGVQYISLPIRYAMSTFYVQFMVLANVFHVEARVIAVWCMRPLCVVLSSFVAYLFGRQLFPNGRKNAHIFVLMWLLFVFFQTAEHTAATFMIKRGFEAKGYCANIVLPALIYAILCIFQNYQKKENWMRLGVVAWASVPLSMSAMMIVPWGIAVSGIVLMLRERNFKTVFFWSLLCVIPNLCYFVLYYLSTKGIFVIQIR